ncbi:PadR family transcriptional regulator [Cellulomonas dongxiuzhuiae]|uniref:PadR family transcriptional regulator n=1 Tax=Cellulomonas dongxiuzhuiae TaxID=2819979 RepID=A0ABX8GHS7_9CELL|nr:PadR family transcriptional regulator [Cellulomonas dongxiuzhuiae]MBO3088521.1 PadR family transcriptional regulator [Cellulomonas dongxiuzhuiae]MBO3094147.1 PadR family transcriptional regulator [Cellulomonas dongxiuzhuiae]QWC15206.1 PadR family transcriptional regulator [Cellulomonas dongxiuzhuiae]
MADSRDSQLLKGVLPMLTLAALAREETYGYELVTVLRAAGLDDLSTGTLYPVLTRLERDGLLISRLVASASGPARKYYRLSAPGLAVLDAQRAAWVDLVATADLVLGAVPPSTDPPDAAAPVPAPTGSPR